MLKVLAIVRRRDGTTGPALVESLSALHSAHAPIPGLHGFVVSEVVDKLRGDLEAEAIVEEWWNWPDSSARPESTFDVAWSSTQRRLKDAGAQSVWLTREHVLKRAAYDDRGLFQGGSGQAAARRKVVGTAFRRDDFTSRAFFDYWFDVHAPISGRAPGLGGYIVCEVLDRLGDDSVDAFVEQWWPDQVTLDAAGASEEVATAWVDVQRYAKTTGTFWVVRERVLVVPPAPGPGLLEI